MGDVEARAPALVESPVKYHSCASGILTAISVNPDAEQCLLGSLAGAVSSQRVTEEPNRDVQRGWQSRVECKGTSVLDCETYKSSRCESRA